jgi:hypothetical protein
MNTLFRMSTKQAGEDGRSKKKQIDMARVKPAFPPIAARYRLTEESLAIGICFANHYSTG